MNETSIDSQLKQRINNSNLKKYYIPEKDSDATLSNEWFSY